MAGPHMPGGAEAFTVVSVTWEDVPVWYHAYCTHPHATTATTFAQGWGNTRFAPISCPDGSPVHTYYAASSFACVVMESLFHDVPLSPPGVFDLDRLTHFRLARLTIPDPIQCVSFHTPHLPALDLTRADLIDSLPAVYDSTRKWSQAAYNQCPGAHAIAYGSRRDDSGRCVMLFGQRLPSSRLTVVSDESMAVEPLRTKVLQLADSLNLNVI
ncbi:RES family NAD+ phosphorylase [Paraburkholderia sp. EG287B]|uniref:RES family NAD+ phosphorylase n=1 Tax=unclassified Paraburkholderia TaxID=2615204 RepID=UPI0034D2E928